jgi:hypothetical protein
MGDTQRISDLWQVKWHTFEEHASPKALKIFLPVADLNGSVVSIFDLKPKGPGFESQIKQGYTC